MVNEEQSEACNKMIDSYLQAIEKSKDYVSEYNAEQAILFDFVASLSRSIITSLRGLCKPTDSMLSTNTDNENKELLL